MSAKSRIAVNIKRSAAWIISAIIFIILCDNFLKNYNYLPIRKYFASCKGNYEKIDLSQGTNEAFFLLITETLVSSNFAMDVENGHIFVSAFGDDRSLRDVYMNSEDKIARTLAGGIIINGIHYPTPPLVRKLIKERWEGREYQEKLAETLARKGEYTIWPTDAHYFIRDCAIKRALVMEPEEPVPLDGLPDLRFLVPVRPVPEETLSITVPPLEDAEAQPFWVRWLQAW